MIYTAEKGECGSVGMLKNKDKEKSRTAIDENILCAEYESVYRYALSLCRSETEAQDITQETFLKAMKSADKFEGESGLYTWLCAIAKNLWINRCKKLSRECSPEGWEETVADGGVSVEERVADRDSALNIHRILHGLGEPYKEVFSLRVFGQLAFSDIASLFGKTESWARVTYHRARKMIIEQMRKEGSL